MSKGGITRQELGDSLSQELDFITGSKKVEKSLSGTSIVKTSIKSPANVKKIDGKTIVNLIPLFDSGAWLKGTATLIEFTSPHKATVTVSDNTLSRYSVQFKVVKNKNYTLSSKHNGQISIYTTDGITPIKDYTSEQSFTFNSGNYEELKVYIRNPDTNRNGTFTWEDIMLTEGDTIKPFVANVKGLTNPTIVNETNGTSLVVPTTLYDGEYVEQSANGELVKYKKWQEIVLDESLNWSLRESRTGYKFVHAPLNYDRSRAIGIKYNGSIIPHDASALENTLYSGAEGYVVIAISNVDSGWGQNYTPTSEEIKAYFLGWIMYQVEEATQGRIVPYNGVGEKIWAVRNTPNSGYVSSESADRPLVKGTGTKVLPTVTPSGFGYPNTSWQPYRLVYELTTPIKEVVKPYSDLTLEKGDNIVNVYSGRIVNEFIVPRPANDGLTFHINLSQISPSVNSAHSPLRYGVKKIKDIKSNMVSDIGKWMPMYTVSNGNERYYVSKSDYNPTSSYTVDYEPLYTWEVTAPIDSVQLQYFETIQAVVDELALENAKQQETINRMLDNVVNKGEGVQWITPTLLNGLRFVSNYQNGYSKDGYNIVTINLFIEGSAPSNAVIIQLPKGFRPSKTLVFPSMSYSDSSISSSGAISLSSNGNLQFINHYHYEKYYHVISLSYKAEK